MKKMQPSSIIIKLLKAIYLETISIVLILIGYVISGGEYNGVTTFLFVLGVVISFGGIFVGIGSFGSAKEVDK